MLVAFLLMFYAYAHIHSNIIFDSIGAVANKNVAFCHSLTTSVSADSGNERSEICLPIFRTYIACVINIFLFLSGSNGVCCNRIGK